LGIKRFARGGRESNEVRNFKELAGKPGNAKSLKRNARARKGILIAPSKLSRVFSIAESPQRFFIYCLD